MALKKNFNIQIPNAASAIINALTREGYEAYIVGGCVRDSMLGKTPHDWDICTSSDPNETSRILRHAGFDTRDGCGNMEKHGTVVVSDIYDGENTPYEVTTFRVDGKYENHRHPSSVTYTKSITEDLLRRDFTINAMAYSPSAGLIDPFHGADDLQMGLIRCVGDPYERFNEDPLRIMRAVRFTSLLQFSVEAKTEQAMFDLKDQLQYISAERLRDELCKTLMGGSLQWPLVHYAPIIGVFIPEWVRCVECAQVTPWHIFDVGEHIAVVVEKAPMELTTRLAAFFHDFGKPDCRYVGEDGRYHFRGHGSESASIATGIMRRLRFEKQIIADVAKLAEVHDREITLKESSIRRALAAVGTKNFMRWMDLRYADVMAQSALERNSRILKIAAIREMAIKEIQAQNCLSIKNLAINGDDLISLGYKQGPAIGKQLRRLLDLVLEHPDRNVKAFLVAEAIKASIENGGN